MKARPSLLMLTALATGVSVLANAVSAADTSQNQTRLGVSIKQEMAQRDQDAARRNRELEMREQAALATEQRLRTSAPPQQQQQQQSATASGRSGAQAPAGDDDHFSELARIYQAMRPKSAAVVFEQLDMDVQIQVAQRMRERSTALIMASMDPTRAAALTMAMARHGVRPSVVTAAAGR